MNATFLFATVAAVAFDLAAVILIYSIGYQVARRQQQELQRKGLLGIHTAIRELNPLEREQAIRSHPDAIFGLLTAAKAKRERAPGDAAARDAEFKV